MEPSEQGSLNQSEPTPATPPLPETPPINEMSAMSEEPETEPNSTAEDTIQPEAPHVDEAVSVVEAPWQPPANLDPILDAHGDEIPFEKLPDLTAEEIIPSVNPVEADEKAPYVERQFIAHLNELKQWLASETASEHPGRIVSTHIKQVGGALDGLIKAVKLVGLQR